VLANLNPTGKTDVAHCMHQLAAMIRTRSLVMLFSDLLTEPQAVLQSLHHLRHRGNEVILFHILDEAEVHFPFQGIIEFEDSEEHDKLTIDARGMRGDYLASLEEFREFYRRECSKANIDYVPTDTSISFDKALMQYLLQRQKRF
jgi:uncharacterized protein (DUF58 family)